MKQKFLLEEFIKSGNGNFLFDDNIINEILESLRDNINHMNKKGILISNYPLINIRSLSNIEKNDLLRLIIDNIKHFGYVINNFSNVNDTENTIMINLLENKLTEIKSKMLETNDFDEVTKLFNQKEAISNKIKATKTELDISSNEISLSVREKNLFNQNVLKKYYDEFGKLDANKFKRFILIEKYHIEGILNIIKSKVNQKINPNSYYDDDILALKEIIEKLKIQNENINLQIENIYKEIINQNNSLKNFIEEYEVESLDELEEKINQFSEENEKNIKLNKIIKDNLGDFILEFKRKLDNKESYEYDRKLYENECVNWCNVVGISCTDDMRELSDRGYNDFDVVIIDEVSKATPPELLIPIMKAKKAILVGDHRQLPPLFNEHEKSYKEMLEISDSEEFREINDLLTESNFKKFKNMVTASLFKNYFEEADETIKHSLVTQYRMHSDISKLINRFYEGKLINGLTTEVENEYKNHNLNIKGIDGSKFITTDSHAYWIDSHRLPNGEEFYESRPKGSTSTENVLECYMIIELLKKMAIEYRKSSIPKEIGVISFYQLQVNRIRNLLKEEQKNFDFSSLKIDINTVDRFQGKEKPIIITSLVRNVKNYRASEKSHIAAFERINVAFSRAQEMLIIVGSAQMYKNQPVKLPKMDKKGEELTVYVYKNIVEELNREACYFTSTKVLNKDKCKEIKKFI